MKKFLTIALLVSFVFATAIAQNAPKKVYDETINPLEQIDNAVKQAQSEGKFVICQVGGNWCPWCLRFAEFITSDSTINKLVNDNFVYIHVNYNSRQSDPAQKELAAQMMKRLGNPARFGYPVFVVLDENGKVIHTQDSSFLEEGKSYNKEKVMRFFECWTPKAVKS